ncbi:UPF0146 family protein [Natrialbaceae archaeon AArc-T1-2]|uniref:UPF0146 family protein n=1 Tax=Natrialbaceae archaeon AArc-T1-2 TaxID=3053904 RepID=UPI00255A9228|nr:UPF0146 family protein [Natrialbaceae archaeon AArc-T1-2]WIV65769.1 UPF0146 family protein [Natrialbaceae archaeon AArc-T1-2]
MGRFRRTVEAIAEYLESYDRLVEVGVGNRPAVAAELVERGCVVTATDVHPRETSDGVTFVEDDVVEPEIDVYADADAIYALNLPPELHRPTLAVARRVDADCWFTTLGGDQPAVPVERRTIPGDTLYVARDGSDNATSTHGG